MAATRRAKGEGSFKTLPNGKVEMRLSKGIKEDGKRKILKVTGSSKQECIKLMRVKEKEYEQNTINKKEQVLRISLAEYINEWLTLFKAKTVKDSSYDRMECTFKNQIEKYPIGKIQMNCLTSEDIQKHINSLTNEYAYSTILKTYVLLNECLGRAFAKGHIPEDVMSDVSMVAEESVKKKTKEIIYYSETDIRVFMSEATKMMIHVDKPKYILGHAFCFMILTGLRAGEMIGLTWADVNFNDNTVIINKAIKRVINREYDSSNIELMKSKGINKYIDKLTTTKRRKIRILHISEQAKEFLLTIKQYSDYTNDEDYVIAVKGGGCNNLKNMTDRLHVIQREVGMNTTGLHVLRHTCASMLFEQNQPIELIASILGNGVEVCRNTYVHFAEKQRALAMNSIPTIVIDNDI